MWNQTTLRDSPYLCPDGIPVTRAVHLARLNSAWSGCDRCSWRHDTEGLADSTVEQVEQIRRSRSGGIFRTEFGVRGRYINDITRFTAAELARIFAACLHENSRQSAEPIHTAMNARQWANRPDSPSDPTTEFVRFATRPVITGYDGRTSSPDLYSGVLSAIREFGLPVVDIGRTTAAAIQFAIRSQPDCCGAIFVTGAGFPQYWAGLDAMTPTGDPVPVVWKDFQIRLLHLAVDRNVVTDSSTSEHPFRDDVVEQLFHRLQQTAVSGLTDRSVPDQSAFSSRETSANLLLELPPVDLRTSWAVRLSRQSGTHTTIDSETRYREWLRNWFPQSSRRSLVIMTDDPLQKQRARWIAETTGIEIICRSVRDAAAESAASFLLRIDDDDRTFTLDNSASIPIKSPALARLINEALASSSSQMTAHADEASGRFWLTNPSNLSQHRLNESIRDALAVCGLVIRLMETQGLSLDH
jgi:hypothetical protein